jgi:hypothetical protein
LDLDELQKLAGIKNEFTGYKPYEGSNISVTGTEKKKIEREKGIEPGTEEWFKLWFSLPYMTGAMNQQPGFRGRKR